MNNKKQKIFRVRNRLCGTKIKQVKKNYSMSISSAVMMKDMNTEKDDT